MRGALSAYPDDVVTLILQHASAATLQRAFFRHQYRHATSTNFKTLRRLLVRELTPCNLDVLSAASMVRKEWRTEPDSWIYEYTRDMTLFETLLSEVRAGLWSLSLE